jgi:hypothetical protein
MTRFLFAIVAALTLIKAEAVEAQSPSEMDVRIQRVLAEHPDTGGLIMDAGMRNAAKGEPMVCYDTILTLVNAESLKVIKFATASRLLIGDDLSGGAALMPSGVYVITEFECNVGVRYHYRQHFAKVTVRAGEVLSAGTW